MGKEVQPWQIEGEEYISNYEQTVRLWQCTLKEEWDISCLKQSSSGVMVRFSDIMVYRRLTQLLQPWKKGERNDWKTIDIR